MYVYIVTFIINIFSLNKYVVEEEGFFLSLAGFHPLLELGI
jgi:hypothetical protein